MPRFGYVPFDEDREEQRLEERAARKAMQRDEVEVVETDERFGDLDHNAPEFESADALAEMLLEDEETTFSRFHLACLNERLRVPVHVLRRALEGYGLVLEDRPKERHFRSFKANPNDRWQHCPTHGGSGGDQIMGFAGQEG